MGLASKITQAIKGITVTALKKHAYNYVDLETPVTDDTFLTKTGSLVTVFEYKGLNKIPGHEEVNLAMQRMSRFLRDMMERGGSTISVVIERNDRKTIPYLESTVKPLRGTADRLNMDIQDVITSDVEEVAKYATYRKVYVVLWTHINSYTPDERKDINRELKEAQAEHASRTGSNRNPLFRDSINPSSLAAGLLDKHAANLSAAEQAFEEMDARSRVLNCNEAARACKSQIEVDTPEKWKPIVLGDKYTPMYQEGSTTEELLDDLLVPRLDSQICTEPHEAVDSVVYEVAGKSYVSMFVSAWSREIRNFYSFEKATPKSVPYRATFLINPGMSGTAINNILGMFTYFMHPDNKKIKLANEYLSELSKEDTMRLQVVITTVGDSKQDVRRNVEAIKTSITEWGSTKLTTDPVSAPELFISSAVGASPTLPIESGLPNAPDLSEMLPLYKPSSQWDSGALAFTTPEGDIMHFEPGSSQQEANSTAIIARPRMGKSVLANAIMISCCVKGGLIRLPLYTSIDIGGSSDGAIAIISESLPPEKRYLARSYQLQMDPERYTKNILDLPLGAARPLPMQRAMIEQMLLMMVTTPGEDPIEGMSELISQLLHVAYNKICGSDSDTEYDVGNTAPIEYTQGLNDYLDNAIVKHGIEVEEHETTMREIRDAFFEKELPREAEIAQRYMVPTLEMLPNLTSEDVITRSFGKESKFDVVDIFNAKLAHAMTQYPILFGHTTFDTAGARVLSIDLTHVTVKDDTGEMLKQNTLMYTMAMMVGTEKFFYHEDQIRFFETRYRTHAARVIAEYSEDEKVLQMDEYHRASPSKQIRNIVKKIELEGPKTNVGLTLISQEVNHFHGSITNFSNIFIMGQFPSKEISLLDEEIGLTASERRVLESPNRMHGPRPGGSSLLHRAMVNEGSVSQLLKFPKGAVGLWGLATSQVDRLIRISLGQKFDGPTARKLLAHYYPTGSIKKEIDAQSTAEVEDEDVNKAVVARIEERIIANATRDKLL